MAGIARGVKRAIANEVYNYMSVDETTGSKKKKNESGPTLFENPAKKTIRPIYGVNVPNPSEVRGAYYFDVLMTQLSDLWASLGLVSAKTTKRLVSGLQFSFGTRSEFAYAETAPNSARWVLNPSYNVETYSRLFFGPIEFVHDTHNVSISSFSAPWKGRRNTPTGLSNAMTAFVGDPSKLRFVYVVTKNESGKPINDMDIIGIDTTRTAETFHIEKPLEKLESGLLNDPDAVICFTGVFTEYARHYSNMFVGSLPNFGNRRSSHVLIKTTLGAMLCGFLATNRYYADKVLISEADKKYAESRYFFPRLQAGIEYTVDRERKLALLQWIENRPSNSTQAYESLVGSGWDVQGLQTKGLVFFILNIFQLKFGSDKIVYVAQPA